MQNPYILIHIRALLCKYITGKQALNSCPYNYDGIHTSEDYCSDEHTLQKLKRQDMNCEETEKLEKLIRKNKDLFFRGGQKLSHAHEVQHEIVTQTVR